MAVNYRKLIKDIECRKKKLQTRTDQNRRFKLIATFFIEKAERLTGHHVMKRGLTDDIDVVYLEVSKLFIIRVERISMFQKIFCSIALRISL